MKKYREMNGIWKRVDKDRYIRRCVRCSCEAEDWSKAPLCESCYAPERYETIMMGNKA